MDNGDMNTLSLPDTRGNTLVIQNLLIGEANALLSILDSIITRGLEEGKSFLVRLAGRYKGNLEDFRDELVTKIDSTEIDWHEERVKYDALKGNIEALQKQVFGLPESPIDQPDKAEIGTKVVDSNTHKDAPTTKGSGNDKQRNSSAVDVFKQIYMAQGTGNISTGEEKKKGIALLLQQKRILIRKLMDARIKGNTQEISNAQQELDNLLNDILQVRKRVDNIFKQGQITVDQVPMLKKLAEIGKIADVSLAIDEAMDLAKKEGANDALYASENRKIQYEKGTMLELIVPGYQSFYITDELAKNGNLRHFRVMFQKNGSGENIRTEIFINENELHVGDGIDMYFSRNGRIDTSTITKVRTLILALGKETILPQETATNDDVFPDNNPKGGIKNRLAKTWGSLRSKASSWWSKKAA